MFTASPELAKRDIYVYDMDGHGLSPFSGRSDGGIAAYVADLKSVLEALGLQKVVLVAHSMNAVSIHSISDRCALIAERSALRAERRALGTRQWVGERMGGGVEWHWATC